MGLLGDRDSFYFDEAGKAFPASLHLSTEAAWSFAASAACAAARRAMGTRKGEQLT
jgi:hypothetical protein